MRGFARMDEIGRRTGRGKRCCNLAPDMPRFADAGHDDPPFACKYRCNTAMEGKTGRPGKRVDQEIKAGTLGLDRPEATASSTASLRRGEFKPFISPFLFDAILAFHRTG